jgi:RNA polymerase I-specific transcription initiation factor Rrn11
MFASVNARADYSGSAQAKDASSSGIRFEEPGTHNPKISRSLVTRRLENLSAVLHLALLRRDHERAERTFAMLLRCERHGVNLRTLWGYGLEILLRSPSASQEKAEEFLARARLSASDIGRHATSEKQVSLAVRSS